jgi:hypothetical protein
MSGATKLFPKTFLVPLCNRSQPPHLARGEGPSPRINKVWWHLARVVLPAGQEHWTSDKEVKIPTFKSQTISQKCYGMAQRQRRHQSYWEASLLSELAATQQIWLQRLSPQNKGGFPYILFRAGYRNWGGGDTVCFIHNQMSFHRIL